MPTIELTSTIRSLKSVYAIVFDGTVTQDIVSAAEKTNVKYIIAMNSKVRPTETPIEILTNTNL